MSARVSDGLEDDVRDSVRYLVRQKEDLPRDGHHVCVRASLERAALGVGQPALALLGVDNPGSNTGLAKPLGGRSFRLSHRAYWFQRVFHVLRNVLAEVVAQLVPSFGDTGIRLTIEAAPFARHGGGAGCRERCRA